MEVRIENTPGGQSDDQKEVVRKFCVEGSVIWEKDWAEVGWYWTGVGLALGRAWVGAAVEAGIWAGPHSNRIGAGLGRAGQGWAGLTPHSEVVQRPSGAGVPGVRAEDKVALPSSAARGPLAAACSRVRAGGLNRCEGAGLPEGRTRGGGVRETHEIHAAPSPSRAPRATLPTPARVEGRGASSPEAGARGLLSEKVPRPGLRPWPGHHPGPDSAAGPAPAHTQKMLNETTPTLLAPRPSSGR